MYCPNYYRGESLIITLFKSLCTNITRLCPCSVLLTPLALLAPQQDGGMGQTGDRTAASSPSPAPEGLGCSHGPLRGWDLPRPGLFGFTTAGPPALSPARLQLHRGRHRPRHWPSAYFWCCPVPAASCQSCSSQGPPRASDSSGEQASPCMC